MEHQILDYEATQTYRTPLQAKKTGVLSGLVGLLFLALVNWIIGTNNIGVSHPALFIVFFSMLVAQMLIAMYGTRKRHYLQIFKAGALATSISLSPTIFFTLASDSLPNSSFAYHFGNYLGLSIIYMLLGLLLGFILWLVPGKMPRFKNKIEA